MSSFVAAILKATVGLLVNKGRNVAAEKLKKGDVTNEQLRNLIVRELDDIKSKLHGIARKDLLASISFFKEGLVYLYKVNPKEERGEYTAAASLKQDVGSPEASVKTVSLAEEMRSFQLTDRDSSPASALNDAKNTFEEARKEATRAFCNEALSTSDRILAMQYRIMATILEKIDCLTDALAACRLCLEELHSLPAVKKSFDVHLQQGFKSMFNKVEREDTIRSVCRMNRVIFYISEIVEEDTDFSLWPCVEHRGDRVDPLRDVRVTQTIEKEDLEFSPGLKAWPFFHEGEERMMIKDWFITTNTKRQLIIVATDDNSECALLKVFDRIGNLLQSHHLKLPATESTGFSSPVIIDIASDRTNNVSLLVHKPDFHCTVTVFDQHANFQHEFDVNKGSSLSRIAVRDDNEVVVLAELGKTTGCLQVYNHNGVFLFSFATKTLGRVIDTTDIVSVGSGTVLSDSYFASLFQCYVNQFSKQGNLSSKYLLVPGLISRVCFLHKTEHVAVLKFHRDELLLYNKNGEIVRVIKLKLSALRDSLFNAAPLTVVTRGLVATLKTDKRTGKRMIVIL